MVLQERDSRIVRGDGFQPEPSYRSNFAKPHGWQPPDVGRTNARDDATSLLSSMGCVTLNRRPSPDARTSENTYTYTQVSEQGMSA